MNNMDYHEAIETVEALIVRHCEKLRSEAEFLESFSIIWLARLRGSSDPQVRMQATAAIIVRHCEKLRSEAEYLTTKLQEKQK